MNEPLHGRILVVDADYDTLGALSRALRGRGHHVVLAADGRGGLQRAVEVSPDVVLVDQDVPILDVRTFLEVLRDNPRTSGTHAFLMGEGDRGRFAAIDTRAEPIVKPFNAEEVAARVDEVLRARLGPKREPELRGDLGQVALFDLLQVFSVNRRTGRLLVEGPVASGEVWVRAGRIVDAVYGRAVGEKALFRILGIGSGQFVFAPGMEAERARIDAPTDHLLMEAARQDDERERLRERLPPLAALVSLAARPAHVTPMQSWILDRLEEPRAIEELLDLSGAHDIELLEHIAEMLAHGALMVFDPRGEHARVCDPDEAVAMRAAVTRLRRPGLEGPARLGVLAQSLADVARFARALASVEEFVAAPQPVAEAGHGAFGPMGVLRIEGTDLELFALPLDPPLRPLWGALLSSARVVLSLGSGDPADEVEELLRALEVSLVPVPPGWERPKGAAEAMRAMLSQTTPRTPVPE